jgi:methionine sulfoxide reductase catalytic subunit
MKKLKAQKTRLPLPREEATPPEVWLNRRRFIKAAGLAGLGMTPLLAAGRAMAAGDFTLADTMSGLAPLPSRLDQDFTLDRPLTARTQTARYNNFYEFSTGKKVWEHVRRFQTSPWHLEISGLIKKPLTISVRDLITEQELEERLYRFRCVEAWAMAVPWIGFPLSRLLEAAQPLASARYVRFGSFLNRSQAPGQNKADTYNLWPYFEGLTLPEAMNPLSFLVVGMYGHELPKQSGAPLRLILPWKYGYKGAKSLTKIELVAKRPATFWNTLIPHEYGFFSNVNPHKPHPRWSQASERMLGSGVRRPTLLYNGYQKYVKHLYRGLRESDPRFGFGRKG